MTTSNHMNSTIATNVSSHATITNAQEEKVREALTILHSIVASRGPSILPSVSDMSDEQLGFLANRAVTAIVEKNKERHADLLALASAKVADVVQAARDEAAVLVAEFNDMSEKLRAKLNVTCPDHATIPYADLVACFPAGTKDSYITKSLSDMKLVVVSPKGGTRSVKVSLTA